MTDDSLGHLEEQLGKLLVTGVIVSAALLSAGLILWLVNPGAARAGWVLNAGLIVLMGTPITRVALSVAEYVRLKQWFFVAVTLIVLAELAVTVGVALWSHGNRG